MAPPNRAFWIGLGWGLASTLGFMAALLVAFGSRGVVGKTPLRFEPQVVPIARILPAAACEFEINLRNLSNSTISLDEVRCSHPLATGRIAHESTFPVKLSGHSVLPVHVSVRTSGQESGRGELRVGVVGRIGSRSVAASALAEFDFVQVLNAKPKAVALGELSVGSPIRSAVVVIWTPAELTVPEVVSAESNDPCVTVKWERFPVEFTHRGGDFQLGKLTLLIDPAKAPERLSALVTVASDAAELAIPVLGVFKPYAPKKAVP